MSKADKIFIQNMKDILENGVWDTNMPVRPRWEDGTPAHTIKKFGLVNRYDLSEELPILTIRKTNFSAAVDELLWMPGRTKPVLSVKPTATNSHKNIFIKRVNSTRWIGSFSI